jgi:hypothetical protein
MEWNTIQDQLLDDWPRSHIILRSVMKRELGFTVRKHDVWLGSGMGYATMVYLDFLTTPRKLGLLLNI